MDSYEKEWFIQMPWGRLAVMAWGDSTQPPILICHGKQDTASSFRPLIKKLPRNWFFVAVDLPGNGRSDPFSPGLPVSTFDYVYCVKRIVDHFNWSTFIYMGHSLGCLIGKYYYFAYRGKITRMVDLDPVPVYLSVEPDEFPKWNWKNFGRFFDNYNKLSAPKESAPKYTYETCLNMIMKNRRLNEEGAKQVLERVLEPAGDGYFRFTFDQRMRMVIRPPLSAKQMEKLYATIDIPIHITLARKSIDEYKSYDRVPFIFDEKAPRSGPYSVVIVEGYHDVHISHPESVAPSVADFLLKDFGCWASRRSKL